MSTLNMPLPFMILAVAQMLGMCKSWHVGFGLCGLMGGWAPPMNMKARKLRLVLYTVTSTTHHSVHCVAYSAVLSLSWCCGTSVDCVGFVAYPSHDLNFGNAVLGWRCLFRKLEIWLDNGGGGSFRRLRKG